METIYVRALCAGQPVMCECVMYRPSTFDVYMCCMLVLLRLVTYDACMYCVQAKWRPFTACSVQERRID